MARIIILAARNWSLLNEKRETISGIKVEGSEANVSSEEDYRGSGAVEYKVTPAVWDVLKTANLPGVYDVEVGLSKAKNAKGVSVAVAMLMSVQEVFAIDMSVTPVKKAA